MNSLKIAIAVLAISIGGKVHAQDLLAKVPEDSKFVVALNSKGFFKHANVNQLNNIFKNAGMFDAVAKDNESFKSENIEEFGIDLNAKSYLYLNVNDSIQYFGALIPLKDKAQFESILPEDSNIEVVNGLNTIYSDDKKLRISWNQQTIYVLGGSAMTNYFSREDVKERYGLLSSPEYDWTDEAAIALPDTVSSLDWEAWEADTAVASADSIADYLDVVTEEAIEAAEEYDELNEISLDSIPFDAPPPPMITNDEFDYVDSVLDQDEYQDDYYQAYSKINNYNDSIKNEFVHDMVNVEIERIISGNLKPYKSKTLSSMKDNELVRMEVQKLDSLITYYYPADLLYGYMTRPTFNYGYEKINTSILVDGNQMKLVGDVVFDKETSKYYKEMYKHKLNPKFYSFLSDDALGFISFNLNTEAYIKYMPSLVNRIYGGMDVKYSQIIDLATTMFDIVVDEKAIAKVFKGDNLFVLNGVTQKEVKYIDYEYDDDYNYTEIEKTKTEKVPNYMWVFSSDDTRVFEKIIKVLENESEVINHDGIFEIKSRDVKELAPYILMGQGMVFLGNDLDQLKSIKANNFKGKGGSKYVSVAKKNSVAMLFNTKRIPGLVDDLELPVHRSMSGEIKNLAQYGDLYIISNGMKGNSFKWEAGLEFPNTNANALDFILNSLYNMSEALKN